MNQMERLKHDQEVYSPGGLRDQFAMSALSGLVTGKWIAQNGNSIAREQGYKDVHEMLSIIAYRYSDAMLLAREVKK